MNVTKYDQDLATEYGIPAERVAGLRESLIKDKVLRRIISDRIEELLRPNRDALETIDPDELRQRQGVITGIKLTRTQILPEK